MSAEISKLSAKFNQVYAIRNLFTHGVWGTHQGLPDALLLCKVEPRLKADAALLAPVENSKQSKLLEELLTAACDGEIDLPDHLQDKLFSTVSAFQKENSQNRSDMFASLGGAKEPEAEVWTRAHFLEIHNLARLAHAYVTKVTEEIWRSTLSPKNPET